MEVERGGAAGVRVVHGPRSRPVSPPLNGSFLGIERNGVEGISLNSHLRDFFQAFGFAGRVG